MTVLDGSSGDAGSRPARGRSRALWPRRRPPVRWLLWSSLLHTVWLIPLWFAVPSVRPDVPLADHRFAITTSAPPSSHQPPVVPDVVREPLVEQQPLATVDVVERPDEATREPAHVDAGGIRERVQPDLSIVCRRTDPVETHMVEPPQPVAEAPAAEAAPDAAASPVPEAIAGENEPPTYPARALRLRLQGTVLLRVVVGEDGAVRECRVVASSGHDVLDRAAVEAVEEWRFRGGPGEARLPITFALGARLRRR